ncbi:MAG: lysostaphin resistance A-like protein [Gemmatimonadaceae bacterium]
MTGFMKTLARIVLFTISVALIYGFLEFLAAGVPGVESTAARQILIPWLLLISVLLPTVAFVRFDSLPWSELCLDRAAASPKLLAKGLAFGALSIGVASAFLLALGELKIRPTASGNWWRAAATSLLILLPAGFVEELFIRGYLFAALRRLGGWKLALIVTSFVFGLIHAWNPGADAESILAVTVAGFFLGAILLATRSLYAAGTAHFAWNWIMAGALHTPVSGISSPVVDYETIDAGPDWLTGGQWGPEGGLAAVIAMFLVVFYLYGRYLHRMEWTS